MHFRQCHPSSFTYYTARALRRLKMAREREHKQKKKSHHQKAKSLFIPPESNQTMAIDKEMFQGNHSALNSDKQMRNYERNKQLVSYRGPLPR